MHAWILGVCALVGACSFDASTGPGEESDGAPSDAAGFDAATPDAGADLNCGPGVGLLDIVLAETFSGTTVDGTLTMTEACMDPVPSGGPEKVHVLTVPEPGSYRATIIATSYDAILFVRTDCDDPATTLPCNDGITPDTVAFDTTAANASVFVVVDSHTGNGGGNYQLLVAAQ